MTTVSRSSAGINIFAPKHPDQDRVLTPEATPFLVELHRRFNAHCQDFHRGRNLDLKAIARVQLMEAGVARIHDTEICTICCDPALTFSYRREGPETGRQAAVAWLSWLIP